MDTDESERKRDKLKEFIDRSKTFNLITLSQQYGQLIKKILGIDYDKELNESTKITNHS